jgi:transcriptional regulator with XRE-family HTH domain
MDRIDVEPKLLRWARDRAGLGVDALAGRFPRIEAWERGEARPTLKQLERFARATSTPVGYLFLRDPPVERIPIADFRAGIGSDRGRPSANLLDAIYLCQQRQNWYRDFVRTAGERPIGFVGSASTEDDVPELAAGHRR